MKKQNRPHIKPIDYSKLFHSLNYLYVGELKEYCEELALSNKGKKVALIARILHFLKTGERIDELPYPAVSMAKTRKAEQLSPDTLMLKGSYKNDLRTRLFFKTLVGDHFHFTAFGIDWLDMRWMQGNPPNYKEFADMWHQEYEFRKINGSVPKAEWAYINFIKRYLANHQKASREDILKQWERERNANKDYVSSILMECRQ